MVNPYRFYTYAYLRKDKTPYYIGKGTKYRAYFKNRKGAKPPKDVSRIIILKQNLTEEEAFKHEKYMIAVFGRKDLGTGILHNRSDGGEGNSGLVHNDETKRKIGEKNKGYKPSVESNIKRSEALKGQNNPSYGKRWWNDGNGNQVFSIECPLNWYSGRSEDVIQKGTETRKGRKWWNDGKGNDKFSKECPGDGWVLGRSEESKRNMSISTKNPPKETREKYSRAKKGVKWWNDGKGNNKFSKECPGEGWVVGMSEESKIRKSKKLKGKTRTEEQRRRIGKETRIRNIGRKWWNDGFGNSKFAKECPGEGWFPGRGHLTN